MDPLKDGLLLTTGDNKCKLNDLSINMKFTWTLPAENRKNKSLHIPKFSYVAMLTHILTKDMQT